jgi:hypothetical protein
LTHFSERINKLKNEYLKNIGESKVIREEPKSIIHTLNSGSPDYSGLVSHLSKQNKDALKNQMQEIREFCATEENKKSGKISQLAQEAVHQQKFKLGAELFTLIGGIFRNMH